MTTEGGRSTFDIPACLALRRLVCQSSGFVLGDHTDRRTASNRLCDKNLATKLHIDGLTGGYADHGRVAASSAACRP